MLKHFFIKLCSYQLSIILLCIIQLSIINSQAQPFTHDDTLRGSIGPGRSWWDVKTYELKVKFNLEDSTISGSNTIWFDVLKQGNMMQIDLQEPLVIDSGLLYLQNN